MRTYKMYYEKLYSVEIQADDPQQAEQKFFNNEYKDTDINNENIAIITGNNEFENSNSDIVNYWVQEI